MSYVAGRGAPWKSCSLGVTLCRRFWVAQQELDYPGCSLSRPPVTCFPFEIPDPGHRLPCPDGTPELRPYSSWTRTVELGGAVAHGPTGRVHVATHLRPDARGGHFAGPSPRAPRGCGVDFTTRTRQPGPPRGPAPGRRLRLMLRPPGCGRRGARRSSWVVSTALRRPLGNVAGSVLPLPRQAGQGASRGADPAPWESPAVTAAYLVDCPTKPGAIACRRSARSQGMMTTSAR